jgi:hypothetical protein
MIASEDGDYLEYKVPASASAFTSISASSGVQYKPLANNICDSINDGNCAAGSLLFPIHID